MPSSRSLTLVYGDHEIPYRVNRDSKRSNRVAIHVDPDGTVIVDAPPDHSEELIARAVQRRARWVHNNVLDARQRHRNVIPREYVSGEEILYLGRRYVLKVIKGEQPGGSAKLRGSRLEVTAPNPTRVKVKTLVGLWYHHRALEYFNRRVHELSKRLPWVAEPPSIKLMEMARQWGNCSPRGQIVLNPHLIKAPRDGIDYVLIHELAHLKHHHHGKAFQLLLDQHIPNWRSVKHRLDNLVEVLVHS
ncbi:M48 family metallopeptidase [Rhodobacteraceae bacterium NNCM2]|nr:M48 family metallopeptidase [Coraliihabitans acroporae]